MQPRRRRLTGLVASSRRPVLRWNRGLPIASRPGRSCDESKKPCCQPDAGCDGRYGIQQHGVRGEQVPFNGTLEGTYTRTGSFPFFHIEPIGTGHATHLGRFSFSIPHDVNLLLSPPGGFGTFEFTAANGDSLYGIFLTSATPVPEMPGFIYGVEPMTILGGTGRFTNASGSLLCERLVDTVNLTTTGSSKEPSPRPEQASVKARLESPRCGVKSTAVNDLSSHVEDALSRSLLPLARRRRRRRDRMKGASLN